MPKAWQSDFNDVNKSASSTDKNPDSDPKPNTDPGPDAGNQSGNGDGEGKPGRGIEELRGEMLRKMDASNRQLKDEMIGEMKTVLSGFQAGAAANTNSPQGNDGGELADLSIPQLRELYAKAENKEQEAMVLELMTTAKAREIVGTEIRVLDQSMTQRNQRQEAMKTAFARFPELQEDGSSFREAVLSSMAEMGAEADDPRALLNVANETAFRMGISPAASRRRDEHRPTPTPGRSNRPAGSGGEGEVMAADTYDEIAAGLANAFPDGISDDAKKRILARSTQYNTVRDDPHNAFIKG